MSNYYAAIIRATRASASAIAAMNRINRQIRDASVAGRDYTALSKAYTNAYVRYNKAQDILRSHPLSAADIAARQASYPKARNQ